MNVPAKLSLLGALLASEAMAQAAGSSAGWLESLAFTASASANRVENISRTSNEATRKDATSYELALGATRHQQLAPSWLMDLGADAEYLSVPEYDRTSSFKLGPRIGIRRKFGLGPLAPTLQGDAAYSYKTLRIAGGRGWTAEAGLRLAKRLNSSVQVAASGRWLEHYANSATFDLQQRTFGVEATWDINDRWRLSGSASRLEGHVVANAAWKVWEQAIEGGLGPTVANYYNSIPWEETDSYGPRWVSYNVEAHANLWSLTLGCALSDHTSLELRTSSAFVINKINVRYPTDSWGLSVIHRF